MTMTWPPTLNDFKDDLKIPHTDTRDDTQLAIDLAAAITKVASVRAGSFKFDPLNPAQWSLPVPTDDILLGTLRLAGRWNKRRRSADGMVMVSQEMGSNRVPSFDADIDRLLGIGRFRGPVIA